MSQFTDEQQRILDEVYSKQTALRKDKADVKTLANLDLSTCQKVVITQEKGQPVLVRLWITNHVEPFIELQMESEGILVNSLSQFVTLKNQQIAAIEAELLQKIIQLQS